MDHQCDDKGAKWCPFWSGSCGSWGESIGWSLNFIVSLMLELPASLWFIVSTTLVYNQLLLDSLVAGRTHLSTFLDWSWSCRILSVAGRTQLSTFFLAPTDVVVVVILHKWAGKNTHLSSFWCQSCWSPFRGHLSPFFDGDFITADHVVTISVTNFEFLSLFPSLFKSWLLCVSLYLLL